MLLNRRICYYMIIVQIAKGSGLWLLRYEGLKKTLLKTLKRDAD